MSTLIIQPYNYDGGDSIWAKVSAENFYGESPQSIEGNDAYYIEVPVQPISLAEDISVRTATKDGLTWSDGGDNGGSPVIDYRVNRRVSPDGVYSVIGVSITTQSYTATGLTLGVTYDFTVESRNIQGYSPVSELVTILHAIPPEQPVAPITTNNG